MKTPFDPDDAVVLKLASLACLDMMGSESRGGKRVFAAEIATPVQPVDTAMQKLTRLRVGDLKPFTTKTRNGKLSLEYTGDSGPRIQFVCAALLKRLLELLLMPIPEDHNRWQGGDEITPEEMATIKELARTIRIEPEAAIVH